MRCRLCGNTDTPIILDLGMMPLSNSLLNSPDDEEELYPLQLCFCINCSLVQITETIPPEKLFRDYLYFSSVSQTMVEHVRELADKLISERGLGKESLVMEAASNDGYFLQHFLKRGIPVIGIDPSTNAAVVAQNKGVRTICDFFGEKLSVTLPKADVFLALNVLGHVDDIIGFVSGIQNVLKPDGVAVIEVPYIRPLIENSEAETLYFEHLFYYSVTSLVNLFRWHRLQVVRIEEIDIHGGSIRVYVTHPNPAPSADRYGLESLLNKEKALGIDRMWYYYHFKCETERRLNNFRDTIIQLKNEGKRLVGYGAAAKGVQLLNMAKIDSRYIDCVIDSTPAKQGKYLPGSHIQVVSPEQMGNPDAIIILAWNWEQEIKSRHPDFNGQWFVASADTTLRLA